MEIKVGDKVRLIGRVGEGRYDSWPEGVWAKNGVEATVTELHPRIPGTGLVLGYDEDGTPVIDEGIEPWFVAEIVPGAGLGLDISDEGVSWERV